ncbi:MAG TPA: HAMP domain-containing sensor histidine kinase [Rhodanobacteraceae bacterium]|nr:HAMP domain-containing sensor histidine kinase [Rhodanobacteraceae bacterium]
MSPLKSPLFWRLLVWFCVANLLVFVLGGVVTHYFVEYSASRDINWSAMAQQANEAYENGGESGLRSWIEDVHHDGVQATLYQDGRALQPVRLPPSVRRMLPRWLDSGRDVLLRPRPGVYVSIQQLAGSNGQPRQFVGFAFARTPLTHRSRWEIFLAVQVLLSLLLIGLAGWWVARGVARPVKALSDAARRMAAGELSTRVDERWQRRDELGQLALDFNGMAERIEALVAHDRGVLQDLSHELRSPLARLHLILDLAQHSATPAEAETHFLQAEREIARLDRMTGEMLALARLKGDLPGMAHEPVELVPLVEECVATMRVPADGRQITLQLTHVGAPAVAGSAVLLRRAIENLIANAIKFSPQRGCVRVDLRTEAGRAIVEVRDHGPGVPVHELELLFRPFFRGSNAQIAEGQGLGLTLVQRVVKAHGGEVRAENAGDGGLIVALRLPLLDEGGVATNA